MEKLLKTSISNKTQGALIFVLGCLLLSPSVQPDNLDIAGHGKLMAQGFIYPDDSLFDLLAKDKAASSSLDVRLITRKQDQRWLFQMDYQVLASQGELTKVNQQLPTMPGMNAGLINDDDRLMDLTWTISDQDRSQSVHRIDRLMVGYTTENTVIKLGRQAVSWGNGLNFHPLDFLNPFDPLAIDTEFKAGDDMLYGQYLLDSGDDLQWLWVARSEDTSGRYDGSNSSYGIKYHGFFGEREIDVLVAINYEDWLLGLGTTQNLLDATWRTDLSITQTDNETVFSAVSNLSYSWVAWNKNVSAHVEYYYSGFGVDQYDLQSLPSTLTERISRGELFTLGKHYLATSLTVETTPLLQITPNILLNIQDPSALFQLAFRYDLSQEWLLIGDVRLPLGSNGSEFGGIPSTIPDRYINYDTSGFLQLAWYY